MTMKMTCDYCGNEVERRAGELAGYLTVKIEAPQSDEWNGGYVGHYHDECWERLNGVFEMAREWGGAVATLPVVEPIASRPDRRNSPIPRGEYDRRTKGRTRIGEILRADVVCALWKIDVITIEELAHLSREDVESLPGVGPVTMLKIEEALVQRSLRFGRARAYSFAPIDLSPPPSLFSSGLRGDN